mgnify:CR=1 FL=1
MYRANLLKNIDKYRNYMLILEYNFYKSKQKEKIMKMPKEIEQWLQECMKLYYKDNFKGKEFDLALLLTMEKEVLLLKETFVHFILLRNVLIYIKQQKSKNLSDTQMKILKQTILGVKNIAKELLNILLPILEGIGD